MPAYAAYRKPLLKIISDKGSICASNAPPFGKPLTKDSPHRSYRPRPTSKPPFAQVAYQNNVRIIGKVCVNPFSRISIVNVLTPATLICGYSAALPLSLMVIGAVLLKGTGVAAKAGVVNAKSRVMLRVSDPRLMLGMSLALDSSCSRRLKKTAWVCVVLSSCLGLS